MERLSSGPDDKKIYFSTYAWVTTGAIYAVDINTRKTKLISPGNDPYVLSKGEYKGTERGLEDAKKNRGMLKARKY